MIAPPIHFVVPTGAPSAIHAPASAVDAARFLGIIVAIEGNHPSAPGGIYGLGRSTWAQHSRLPYRYASISPHNRHVAGLHLRWLERSLEQFDQPVTVYTLAAAWRFGLEGGIHRMHLGRIDYADRADNLYHSAFRP